MSAKDFSPRAAAAPPCTPFSLFVPFYFNFERRRSQCVYHRRHQLVPLLSPYVIQPRCYVPYYEHIPLAMHTLGR